MRRHGIGGALDYTRLAQVHRPRDPQAIAREVRRLANTGLKPRDVAVMLGLSPSAVADMLDPPESRTSVSFGTEVKPANLPVASNRSLEGASIGAPSWAALTKSPLPPASAAITELVGRAHGRGLTAKEIAAELGLSVATVLLILSHIAIRER